jgi:hypothetical protein
MAEEKKETTAVKSDLKTKQVEIIKFHPLIAHEVEDRPILTEDKANELIKKGYAKEVK